MGGTEVAAARRTLLADAANRAQRYLDTLD
jgi:hypothetical protein